jgi:hypothetical protein
MNRKVVTVAIILLLLINPGCTQKKDLKSELEKDMEYWKFLGKQGVRDLEYAKAVTLVYITIAEKTGENPVDVLLAWREEMKGKKTGEVREFLMETGMTNEEALLITSPLLSSSSDWDTFMFFMVAVDDYVTARISGTGIPARKAQIKQTYKTPDIGGGEPGGPPPAGH